MLSKAKSGMLNRFMLRSTSQMLLILAAILTIFACSQQASDRAQGYIEGHFTYLASNSSGKVETLFVRRGQRVKEGEVLANLEPQPESDTYQANVENLQQSIAERDAIQANLDFAKITYERNKILVEKHAIQISELDNAKANYTNLQAQLAKANANIASVKANLAQAKWTKDQKSIVAPLDGMVFDVYYRIGEFVKAQQSVISLLAPADIKAIFYVDEINLGRIKLNQAITVQCDSCSKTYEGHVSFISPEAEYTPPVIFSEQTNAKLVYRIEAIFTPEDAYQLHPGQPVTVKYD